MKKRVLPFVFLILLLAGSGVITVSSIFNDHETDPLSNPVTTTGTFTKAKEFLSKVRNNQTTGILQPGDVIRAREQAGKLENFKSTDFNWMSMGPNNIGGRTRAIVFDNRDSELKTIYAAGVTGGIFKSTNYGATWNNIDGSETGLYVTCMLQAPDNSIYAGTGEGFNLQDYSPLGDLGYSGGFVGKGIFKIDGNDNISPVQGTQPTPNSGDAEWAYINDIALASDGKLWAATNTGVKTQTGTGWVYAQYTDSTGTHDLMGLASDIKAGSNGVVIAAVDGKAYVSTGGSAGGFICVSTGEEDKLSAEGVGRIEFAIAPSNQDIIYALTAKDSDKSLENIYLSEDKGVTWRVVAPGGSNTLNILGSYYLDGATVKYYYQGDYCNAITVFPQNPYKILAGGVNLWMGEKVNETGYFSWAQKSIGEDGFMFDPTYAHVDHHTYVFRPDSSNEFLIGCDGGVFKAVIASNEYVFEGINTNFTTSQFYNVAPTINLNFFMGGTQDNGTTLVREQNNQMVGSDMWLFNILRGAGDGGFCAVSSMEKYISNEGYFYPVSFYSTSPNRSNDALIDRMRRSETFGFDFSLNFLDDDIISNNFLTPMILWESYNDINSELTTSWVADKDYNAGETVTVRSRNFDYPFSHTLENNVTEGDTITVKDIITTRLFIGGVDAAAKEIWMTTDALLFNVTPEWFLISNTANGGFNGTPSCMAYSADANYLFVGTYEGLLYRISNIASAYDYEEADVRSSQCIIATDEIEFIAGGNSQAITSVSIDPANANKVLVTLGNYGNANYVYYTSNGLADFPDFESVQGNLPQMPVYTSLFEMDPSNDLALLGTDEGIFVTDNISSGNWYPSLQGIGKVPVLDIKQQKIFKPRIIITHNAGTALEYYEWFSETANYGVIYVATYGKGVFADSTLFIPLGTEESTVSNRDISNLAFRVYPNPVGDEANLSFILENNAEISVKIYDISGRMVIEQDFGNMVFGLNHVKMDVSSLVKGAYIIHINAGSKSGSEKIIIK
ncbi:MAG: T9SS type A sorting domain-containing protein [Bacteroidales bacterium]|nr:T9SS type A sorting domain-containing protein [Bacteroidales bacterium]